MPKPKQKAADGLCQQGERMAKAIQLVKGYEHGKKCVFSC